jgi:hypothetical protein
MQHQRVGPKEKIERGQIKLTEATGNEPIQSGDRMDVEPLSVGIPVAHYLLTDRRMELRIKQRQLDNKWGTAVFSMATIDGLFAELERLA